MKAAVGVIGGSGLYELLDGATVHELDTPWGRPSAPVTVGHVDDVPVAFLPRHGRHHELPPHNVPYRANIDALRQLGVKALIGPFAAGSLQADVGPGDLVVVDQLVDRTWGRPDTFADGPQHISFADPYDATVRAALLAAARSLTSSVHDGGTVVVVQGPRFSTRAESAWYRAAGWQLVNMTQHPEAALAREAEIPYGGLALVTDYDAGLAGTDGIEPVTQEEVFRAFDANLPLVREVVLRAATSLAASATS